MSKAQLRVVRAAMRWHREWMRDTPDGQVFVTPIEHKLINACAAYKAALSRGRKR